MRWNTSRFLAPIQNKNCCLSKTSVFQFNLKRAGRWGVYAIYSVWTKTCKIATVDLYLTSVCACMYEPLDWGLLDSATTGPGLLPDDPVSRLFNATSRLLLLSISACRAASLLKPISMMSLNARSSTCTEEVTERTHKRLHRDSNNSAEKLEKCYRYIMGYCGLFRNIKTEVKFFLLKGKDDLDRPWRKKPTLFLSVLGLVLGFNQCIYNI